MDALRAADWESVAQTCPDSMAGFYYSVTLPHPMSPVTLDLHHRIQGLMKDPAGAFEVMWGDALLSTSRTRKSRRCRRARPRRGGV